MGSTITHTRAPASTRALARRSFAIAGDGAHGGTKIALDGPWLLQGFHRQGRQYHRESRRPRRDVDRGQGPAGCVAGRLGQDPCPALIRSRSRTATANNRARTWNRGPRSTASGCRHGGGSRGTKAARLRSRARSASKTSRLNSGPVTLGGWVWRERMGIEPTRSLFPDPSPVLKTGPGTSHGRAPERCLSRTCDEYTNIRFVGSTGYFTGFVPQIGGKGDGTASKAEAERGILGNGR